ncbi:thyroid hormone-inducible hepatic protein [Fundulus heteroclitus]|uniref:thyroid hormone-inducible hepatic protein n=1 Tax=Fundulus heteroclitus TaxID=8078 RepID=UPI00165C08F5|nr:thyroid hormone-inducible hepatic protein [Fundulus heteroclitus]
MMQLRKHTDQPTSTRRLKRSLSLQLCTACQLSATTAQVQPSTSTGTMQSPEAKFNRNSLFLTLKSYSSAVSDMEKTILLPSLLRDVPSDCEAADETCRDLYANYMMLKAIRNTAESSLVSLDDHKTKNTNTTTTKALEPFLDADSEALFLFHLRGLFSVMSDLTKKTRSLTEKYLDILGLTN